MNEPLTLTLVWVAGVLLGTVFFGGLWWTVQKGLSSKQPALWFLGGLILRMLVTVSGFYFVSGGHWERLLTCLFGFVVASVVVTRVTRPTEDRVGDAPHP